MIYALREMKPLRANIASSLKTLKPKAKNR